jgi:outer membrane protein assembly factor BamA
LQPGEVAVGSVNLVGAEAVDEDVLLDGLGLVRARETGQAFERYLVALDRRRLRNYYQRRGFFNVDVQTDVTEGKNPTDVTFRITEGRRARLVAVEITGAPTDGPFTQADLRAQITLPDGAPFDYDVYDLDRPKLAEFLEDAGYAHAKVSGLVIADRTRDQATIRIAIDAGPRARFGPVTIKGMEGDLADAARNRLTVHEGDAYKPKAIADSRSALYELGRFSVVRIEPDRSARGEIVPVTVTLVEASRHEFRAGGGVGMTPEFYEARLRARYAIDGWPRPLMNTSVEVRPAIAVLRDEPETQPRFEAIGRLERLDLFRPRLRGEVEASLSYLVLDAYTTVGPRVRLGLDTPLFGGIVQLGAGWQIRVLDFSNIDTAINPALVADLGLDDATLYRLGTYDQRLSVDFRDHPVSPRWGVYGELRLEEGTPYALGAFSFVRLLPELRAYAPLGPVTAAARARLGLILGDVPVTERFFAGGASSQRGFAERQLAPFATETVGEISRSVVYGGAALLEVGGELRATVGKYRDFAIATVAFLDGADVTDRVDQLDAGRLHWAAGGGLRVGYLGFSLRIDVGYRLNRYGANDPEPGDRLAWHISAGEAF